MPFRIYAHNVDSPKRAANRASWFNNTRTVSSINGNLILLHWIQIQSGFIDFVRNRTDRKLSAGQTPVTQLWRKIAQDPDTHKTGLPLLNFLHYESHGRKTLI